MPGDLTHQRTAQALALIIIADDDGYLGGSGVGGHQFCERNRLLRAVPAHHGEQCNGTRRAGASAPPRIALRRPPSAGDGLRRAASEGDPRADAVLRTAAALLEQQANMITDRGRRRMFREQVAAHRAIEEAMAAKAAA
jgi:hypothetical protein